MLAALTELSLPTQFLLVMILVLRRPVPISRLVPETEVPWQPHCAVVVGVHVEDPIPFVIAASRYLQNVSKSSSQANPVGAT